MSDIPVFTLNDGYKMPSVGMGCWMGEPGAGERAEQMCKNALKLGYRHFDTAAGYQNEEFVGKALRESSVPRSELFVTTKLPSEYHDSVKDAFESSLKALGLEYIDLYLIHWPQAVKDDKTLQPDEFPTIVDTWKQMEALLDTGKVRSIGVSNFSIPTLTRLLSHPSIKITPAVNQVELHPCLPQDDLLAFCKEKGIVVTAYSSLGQGGTPPFLNEDGEEGKEIKEIAQKYNGASCAQVVLSWAVLRGTVIIPKTENLERMKKNITILNLTPEEMNIINSYHLKPGMKRSLVKYHADGKVFGWTYEQLGWDYSD